MNIQWHHDLHWSVCHVCVCAPRVCVPRVCVRTTCVCLCAHTCIFFYRLFYCSIDLFVCCSNTTRLTCSGFMVYGTFWCVLGLNPLLSSACSFSPHVGLIILCLQSCHGYSWSFRSIWTDFNWIALNLYIKYWRVRPNLYYWSSPSWTSSYDYICGVLIIYQFCCCC